MAEKLLGGGRIKAQLALGSMAILGVGALLTPRGAAPVAVSEERAAPLIEEQLQREEPVRLFAGLHETAATVRFQTVAIRAASVASTATVADVGGDAPPSQPTGFGAIVAADGTVLTHAAAVGGRMTLDVETLREGPTSATVVAYEPATGLVLLRLSAPVPPTVAAVAVPVEQTPLAVGVGHWQGNPITVPLFVTTAFDDRYRLAATAPSLAPGLPLYTPSGALFAIAGVEPGEAFAAGAALERLRVLESAGRGLPASLGVQLQEIEPGLLEVLGTAGALVSDVTVAGPADAAGVQAGDVIAAVGDRAVGTVEDLRQTVGQLTPGAPVTVDVVRSGRRLQLTATAASAFELRDDPDSAATDSPPALRVRDVLTPEQLAASRLDGDTRVVAIGGRRIATPAAARRATRDANGRLWLYLDRGGERFFAHVGERQ